MEEQEKQQQAGYQKITRPFRVIGIISLCIVTAILTFIEIRLYGTGFQGKTLWDWLQLLGVIAIPVVVAVVAILFTGEQHNHDQLLADQRAQSEQKAIDNRARIEREAAQERACIDRGIADDNQREAALQAYINAISELLLEKKLRKSQPNDEVQMIARIRTLTVLHRLDGKRQISVLQFLNESDLIKKSSFIVDLKGVDLSQADLHGAKLRGAVLINAIFFGADLRGADLREADLRGAKLREAVLSKSVLCEANLCGADLSGANLRQADLREAIFTPDTDNALDIRKDILRGGPFGDAILDGADLSGADRTDTKITDEQLKSAKSYTDATRSNGSK